ALRLRDENQGGLVLVLCEMAVHAVVRRVELPAHKPLPEGRVAGIQRRVPVAVPGEQVGILPEAFREALQAEPLVDRWVRQIGLADESGGGIVVLFFLPVNGDLGLADLDGRLRFPGASHGVILLRTNMRHLIARRGRSGITLRGRSGIMRAAPPSRAPRLIFCSGLGALPPAAAVSGARPVGRAEPRGSERGAAWCSFWTRTSAPIP